MSYVRLLLIIYLSSSFQPMARYAIPYPRTSIRLIPSLSRSRMKWSLATTGCTLAHFPSRRRTGRILSRLSDYFDISTTSSNTKKTAFQVQKDAYTLTKNITMTPALGTTLSVVGYGLTNKRNPVDGVKSQVQQIHAGPLTAASKTGDDRWLVRYQVDTMGGNSGSAILNEATKE